MSHVIDRQRNFRQACSKFATGITVIMAKQGSEIHGMTANAFMSVSLDPLLVAVSVSNVSQMHRYLASPDAVFTISILHSGQKLVSEIFGRRQHHPEAQPQLAAVLGGVPVVHDAAAWFLCQKDQGIVAGDHTIIIGRVQDFGEQEHHTPLIFYRGQYFSQLGVEQDEMVEFFLLEQ